MTPTRPLAHGLAYALARRRIDPFLPALAGAVLLAVLLPARGAAAGAMNVVTFAAIALLFFLYGARLAPRAMLTGLAHWRLQSLVFASTYVVFPLLGLAIVTALRGALPAPLAIGLLLVCALPSTVQSSIAFTSIARGNVPAALCSASVSNLAGIVLTPLLMALLLRAHGGFSFAAMGNIAVQLLLPFAAGQALRPLIGEWLTRHRPITSVVDRGSILLVVYAAFSEGIVAGIWSHIGWQSLALVVVLDTLLLALVLGFTTLTSRALGFSREDEIAIVFCGSKKSLASGIPMANLLFAGQAAGMVVLPLMLFHQIQLFACATLAQRYAARPQPPAARLPVAAA